MQSIVLVWREGVVLCEDKLYFFSLSPFLISKLYFQLSCLFYPSTLEIMCVPSLITLNTRFLEKGSAHEPAVPKQKHEFVLMLYLIAKVPHILERLTFVEEGPGAK